MHPGIGHMVRHLPGHQTWNLGPSPPTSVLGPTPTPRTSDMGVTPLLTSGGQHWKPVQTCSLEDSPPMSDIWWWPWKHVWFASGGTHPTGIFSYSLLYDDMISMSSNTANH